MASTYVVGSTRLTRDHQFFRLVTRERQSFNVTARLLAQLRRCLRFQSADDIGAAADELAVYFLHY